MPGKEGTAVNEEDRGEKIYKNVVLFLRQVAKMAQLQFYEGGHYPAGVLSWWTENVPGKTNVVEKWERKVDLKKRKG